MCPRISHRSSKGDRPPYMGGPWLGVTLRELSFHEYLLCARHGISSYFTLLTPPGTGFLFPFCRCGH